MAKLRSDTSLRLTSSLEVEVTQLATCSTVQVPGLRIENQWRPHVLLLLVFFYDVIGWFYNLVTTTKIFN